MRYISREFFPQSNNNRNSRVFFANCYTRLGKIKMILLGRTHINCFLIILALVCFSCAKNEEKSTDQLILTLGENPETLDPYKASLAVESDILLQIGATLLDYGPDLNFYPYLAEKYTVSEDGRVWTFKLREGINHHDGTPFNARTYKKNLERAIAPETASPIAASYLSLVEKIEAPGEYELIITLKKPFLPFAFYLADPFLQPISEAALNKYGLDYGQHPVSVGPFKFKEWQSGEKIILERNNNFNYNPSYYKVRGPVKYKGIVYKVIPERVTTIAALETGKVDVAVVPVEERERFVIEKKFNIFTQDHCGISLYIVMNLSRPPFDDIRVRRAINHAVNKQHVIDAALDGWGVPAYGPAAPLMKGYSKTVENLSYDFNITKAKNLLKEAGWVDHDGDGIVEKNGKPFVVDFWTQPLETWMLASETIQAQLKNVGISLNINSFELGTLLESLTHGNYDMSLMGYTWTADCDILYFYFHSNQLGSGPNYSQCRSDILDDLLTKARQSPNEKSGNKYYRQVQEYIVDQALIVPVYIAKGMWAVNKRVNQIKLHPGGIWLLGDVNIKSPTLQN
jgi:peptide/nickel transport system substrate-binding protein